MDQERKRFCIFVRCFTEKRLQARFKLVTLWLSDRQEVRCTFALLNFNNYSSIWGMCLHSVVTLIYPGSISYSSPCHFLVFLLVFVTTWALLPKHCAETFFLFYSKKKTKKLWYGASSPSSYTFIPDIPLNSGAPVLIILRHVEALTLFSCR